MEDATTRRFGVHLPAVDEQDADAAVEHLLAAAEALPRIGVMLARTEAHRILEEMQHRGGPATHWDILRIIIGAVETLFDEEVTFSPEFHAELVVMLQFPSVPEAAVTQIAFGRHVGEASMRKIEQLAITAEALGRSVDEHVAILASRGEIPSDLPVQCFRGTTHETPDQARMRHAVKVFRTTAALTPEPFRPPVLCVVAWLLWALGKRPLAIAYLRAANEIDPQHPLVGGMAELMCTQQPEWIVR